MAEDKRIKNLNAKKELVFSRLQKIYDMSKDLTTEVKIKKFLVRVEAVQNYKSELICIVDKINDILLENPARRTK